MLEFTVIDTTTNQYPDLWKIATTEEWAKHLMYCDMEGFAISEDGELLLLDECGGVAYCPADRFKVVYTADVAPRAEVAREIFEEIEDVINGIGYFDELDLKALKNKYAGGRNER
jgi:hypothetical protein